MIRSTRLLVAAASVSLAFVACRSSSSDGRADTDAAPTTNDAAGPIDAATDVPNDASTDAPDDAVDAGELDLLLPPWSDELIKCTSEAVHLRLGIRGTFELDVTIGPVDGGRIQAVIVDDGRVYVAPALTCFDRLARKVDADPRSKNRTFRAIVRGPYPRWILKHHG